MRFKLFDLGLIDFKSACQFQNKIFLQVKTEEINFGLILCQHTPTITIGRRGSEKNILATKENLTTLNIGVNKIERGGDVTYHGPGQVCVYPIVNLKFFKKDINWFIRALEQWIISTLYKFGIRAHTKQNLTGVWIVDNKIASIGIAIKNWISLHGFSINIKKSDLGNFSLIRPCGIDIIMTSMESILKKEMDINKVKEELIRSYYERSDFARAWRGN